MMSNAKLKQQIEAAKIALVHSAEADTSGVVLQASNTVTRVPNIGDDHTHARGDGSLQVANTSAGTDAELGRQGSGVQEMVPQSDFEKLEARLQGLEDQIKSQQRDLQTLLQKLRDITAKFQATTKPKKSKGAKKWLIGGVACISGFGAVIYGFGVEPIIATFYHLAGLMVAAIDTLANKI